MNTAAPAPTTAEEPRHGAASGDALLNELHESLHDIRNHLNGILGLVSMLLLQSRDEAAARMRPLIEEQADQLRQLVEQLPDPRSGRRAPAALNDWVDPVRFIPALAALYLPYAAEHGMRLKFSVEPATPRLHTSARLLHRLLSNLLVNAIKHSQASQVLVTAAALDAASPRDGVQFAVVDDGVGIDPGARHTLERVLAGQDALAPAYDRSGLVICSRLAQQLGARVAVDSELGDGTTITVRIPGNGASLADAAAPAFSPA